jgi:predicted kinase
LQGLSVIYDANLNKRIHREQKRQMAARRHAGYQLFWVKTPEELAFKRLSERKGNDADEVTVTPDVFKRFKAELEQPVDETFVEVDGQMPYEEQIKQLERP